MTVIKPPGQPPIQPTGTETPPEPRALPSQPEPAKPTTPGDHDAYQAKSGASPLESHSPPQSLVKPSEHVGVIKPPVITVTGPISPPAIDASLLNALPEQDPNKLQVPIDRRLDEAKANLTTILEALKGQPPLIETHDRLTGELEALAMKHSLHAHQIDIHDANSNGPASHLSVESSRIQSETSELEAEISLLQEQIELTKNPTKYERLSSKSRALLAKLKDFPAIDTNFQQAFSAFVSDYGAEVAESHNLAQNIDVFRHNVDILKQNGKHLEDQRDHMRELLDRPMSAREFKRIENHINQLVSHFERQAHDVEVFNQSTQEFVHFMDSLRENKAAAQAERAYVNQTKTQLLASLNEALDTDFDGSQLQASFADARDALGDQVLSEGGFTRNLEVLQNNLSNVENALHQVRSYAQMLKADVEKADHKGWVDARKENVEEVTQQLKQFHALKTQYESQLDSFLAELNGLQEEAASAPIGEVQHQLQSRLDSLPKLIAVENPLQSYASDVRSLSPAIQQEATQIGEHFQRLNQSANILTEKVSALERKITHAKNLGDLKAARDNLKTLHSLFKRHNSDVRTQQQLADRILDKIPGLTESQRANMNVPAISENGKTLLDRVSRGPDPFFSTMNITSLSYSDGRKITFSTDQRIAVWDSLLKNDTSLDINQLNRSGNTMIHQIIMSAGMAESDKSRMVQYLVSRGADLNRKNKMDSFRWS
ncbi:MAG: hypothetical protein VX834_11040 [Myxococcota bacterium]|nr:hypothetical protein [Myxococcota bacterium]